MHIYNSMLTASVTAARRRIAILAVTFRWWMPADFPIVAWEWKQCGRWSLPASTPLPFCLRLLLVHSTSSTMFFLISVNWLRTLPKAKWSKDRFHFPQIDRKSERTTRAELQTPDVVDNVLIFCLVRANDSIFFEQTHSEREIVDSKRGARIFDFFQTVAAGRSERGSEANLSNW